MFRLHERLEGDTADVCSLGLCRVRLMDHRLWPWLVLVPERPGASEFHHLSAADRARLIEEICIASECVERLFLADKVNVGMLGNLVPQLHVHVVARHRTDPAWPGPVWGAAPVQRYDPADIEALILRIRKVLMHAAHG